MKVFSMEEIQLLKQVVKDELNVEVNVDDSEDIFNKIISVKSSIKRDINDLSNDELREYIQKVEFLNNIKRKLEQGIRKEKQERAELITKLQSLL